MKKHCTALFLLISMLLTTLACERKHSFSVTVDGDPYPTEMKVAKAYLEDMQDIGFGDSGRVILNFPTSRKGAVMGGYGTGLMLRLDPGSIEAGDEFFLGIYEAEGAALIEGEKAKKQATKPSSLDPDAPLDWRADSGDEEVEGNPDKSQWKSRSIEASLEASPVGSPIVSSFTTREPGGGIHIEFTEFEPEMGGRIKGKIIEATLIGRKLDARTHEAIDTGISIMKLQNFSFDTNFQDVAANFGN